MSFTNKKVYLKFLNFEFQISICSNKVRWRNNQNFFLHLDEFYNFGFGDFFHLKSFFNPNFVLSCQILKIQNLNWTNELICKKDQYNSCRSRWVLQFCCLWFFHLKHENQAKIKFNVLINWNKKNTTYISRPKPEIGPLRYSAHKFLAIDSWSNGYRSSKEV